MVLLLASFALGPGNGASGKGTPDAPVVNRIDPRIFASKADGEPASFLVVFRDRADLSKASAMGDRAARRRYVFETLRARADASQEPIRRRLAAAGVPFRSHYLVNMIEVEGDAALARELAAEPDIVAIERNAPAKLELPRVERKAASAAPSGVEPNIQKIRAPELWSRGYTGQGIVIGIADSGFEWDHPAIKNSYRGWNGHSVSHDYNWHDAIHTALPGNRCGLNAAAPCDDAGHGTSVAGLAVGDGGEGHRIGVAPGARLIGCRNMDQGKGTPARYTECFEWFLAPTDSNDANPRPDLGADVINNSWLCPASEGCTNPTILEDVVEAVRAAGVMVVGAAGNNGNACAGIVDAPAIFDATFTIGATDINDQLAGFSSRGPVTVDGSNRMKPDLCAPGVFVRTAEAGGSYTDIFSGTSAAAPHVSGGIALLWSAVPELAGDVDATETALESSALPLTSRLIDWLYRTSDDREQFCGGLSAGTVPNIMFGWGRLDLETAYEMATGAETADPCAADPALSCLSAERFSEFPLTAPGGGFGGIVSSSDGNLWFVSPESDVLSRVTTAGEITEIPLPSTFRHPTSIVRAADGRLWFTEEWGLGIGQSTVQGSLDEIPFATSISPSSIVAGPDGNVWFLAYDNWGDFFTTDRMSMDGAITAFSVPKDLGPADMTAGPDGNLWISSWYGVVARMTTQGVLTGTYPLPEGGWPTAITAGPDGNLWFVETLLKRIGRVTTSGVVTMFPIPSRSSPSDITAGPDGNVWFTETGKIGRITSDGHITEYAFPQTDGIFDPAAITSGPDGNLWFLDWSGKRVGRMSPPSSGCVVTGTTACSNRTRSPVNSNGTSSERAPATVPPRP